MFSNSLSEVAFVFVLIEAEPTLNDQVGPDLDSRMTLPLRWSWPSALWLGPSHHFEIKDVEIIKEILAVPASEN
jgi:hypothetical protein